MEFITRKGYKLLDETPMDAGGQALNDNFTSLGDLYKNLPYYVRKTAPDESIIVSLEIPAIPASTRQVLTVSLGEIDTPDFITIGVHQTSVTQQQIRDGAFVYAGPYLGVQIDSGTSIKVGTNGIYGMPNIWNNMLIVSTNYTKTTECAGLSSSQYGDPLSGTILPNGLTYAAKGVGVLLGYYYSAISDHRGVFETDKCVQMESAWIEHSGAITNLHFALFNADDSANSVKTVNVAVYR